MTNQDIAARIIGFIRQAAIGDPLVPYEQRVDSALQKILAGRHWTTPQRQWLQRIGKQTKAERARRPRGPGRRRVFKARGGGFNRLNKVFGGSSSRCWTSSTTLWQMAA